MSDVVEHACVVCGASVEVQADMPESEVVCINDFFTEDPTLAWESGDE